MSKEQYQEYVDDCGADMRLYELLADCEMLPLPLNRRNYSKVINLPKIPITRLSMTVDAVNYFNEIYHSITSHPNLWSALPRTPSGGISVKFGVLNPPCYDVTHTSSTVCLTILSSVACYRIVLGSNPKEHHDITGRTAYNKLCKELQDDGVDITNLAVDNGAEIKKEIPSPPIKVIDNRYCGKTFDCAHHIDINSSFMAGVAHYNPDLAPTINRIYDNRKKDGESNALYKAILSHSYGFFQSQWCVINGNKYALANLSLDAVRYNNQMIDSLVRKLTDSGRRVIATNTDGVWYSGAVYHDEDEGIHLGQYKNDHTNCTLRYKSAGAYEFIEDGKYYPVIRGQTVMDRLRDREQWQWGDIFKDASEVVKYTWDDQLGIVVDVAKNKDIDKLLEEI